MSLKLIKDAVYESKYSSNKKQTIQVLTETIGKDKTRRIVEGYQVTPDDYTKWLDVVKGYAQDEGLPLRTKSMFQDVAYAVLENDPAPLDQDMQDVIVNTLWANFKAQQQQSKVDKVVRAKEEEEQLKYALKKMKGCEDEEYGFNQMAKSSIGMEDEEQKPFGKTRQEWLEQSYKNAGKVPTKAGTRKLLKSAKKAYPEYFEDEEDFDPRGEDFPVGQESDDWDDLESGKYDEFDDGQEDLDPELDFGEDDEDIIQRASQMRHSRDLEDFDAASDEGMNQDENLMRRAKSQPRAYYAAENEEQKGYSSPFSKGQLVTCKKDGATYKVEIPDGPGDNVGIMVQGRIKMVPSKDLEVPHATEEEEDDTTSNQPTRASFLHDVLTGENSRDNLNKLQQQIETDAANAWTTHHAKMPRNPHPKGSIAFKAWEKGIKKAATEVWAPKPVVVDTKSKTKPKKR